MIIIVLVAALAVALFAMKRAAQRSSSDAHDGVGADTSAFADTGSGDGSGSDDGGGGTDCGSSDSGCSSD